MDKGAVLTQSQINGIISVFKEFFYEGEDIPNPTDINELSGCSFEFIDYINSNEELIFEDKIKCRIIQNIDLGQTYKLQFLAYHYTIDSTIDGDGLKPTLQSKTITLTEQEDNIFTYNVGETMYILPSNIQLFTYYNKPEVE